MDYTASVLQATSGLIFSTFSLVHLGGHLLSPFSFSLSETALFASRELYQGPTLEPLLILTTIVHISSSIFKYFRRSKTSSVNAIKWNRYAGIMTGIFILPHMIGTRLVPMFLLDHSETVDLTLITHFLNHHKILPRIVTYTFYSIGTGCALFHTLYGIQKAFNVLIKTNPFAIFSLKYFKTILWGCCALGLISVLAIGGAFEDIDEYKFAVWEEMEDKMFSLWK